jgi:hypothetical protein
MAIHLLLHVGSRARESIDGDVAVDDGRRPAMKFTKKLAALLIALGIVLGMAGPAGAARADGVCGGAGTYNPVTGECE